MAKTRKDKRMQRVTVQIPVELLSQARDATLKLKHLRFAHIVTTGMQLALKQLEKKHRVKFVASKRQPKLPVGRPSYDELSQQQWKVVA